MIPKLRAWVKNRKRMVFSDDILAIDYENKEIVTQQVCFESGLAVERDIYCNDFYEIELMQSTGLVDKEGTEVFEGDILHHQIQTEYTFIVKYDKDNARWYGDGLSRTYRIDLMKHFMQYYKIIGNIYENPELLEEEE